MPVVDVAAPTTCSPPSAVEWAHSPTGGSPAQRLSPSPAGSSRSSLSPTGDSIGGSRSSCCRSGAVIDAAWSRYDGGSSGSAGNIDAKSMPVVDAVAPVARSPPPAVGAVALAYDDFDSGSEESTDEEDDARRGYMVPVPNGAALRVMYSQSQKAYQCHVCPGRKASRWPQEEQVRSHVIGQATSMAARKLNKKKWSRHRVLAQNDRWL
ncbi:hypothetical protein BDA96_09G112800 [Sorghum bicolor]|uniref:Uncharacterized protein n=1 Tax=Sorghum bicolor TaxID=4558 RepID=A0A921Q8Z0_SORBI|nr:hypothetical protein BDA96_09G112800 [Sorghum bicolor]